MKNEKVEKFNFNLYVIKNVTSNGRGNVFVTLHGKRKNTPESPIIELCLQFDDWNIPWFIRELTKPVIEKRKRVLELIEETKEAVNFDE